MTLTRLVCRGYESVGTTSREGPRVESPVPVVVVVSPVVEQEEEEEKRQIREDGNPLGVAPGPRRGQARRLETHARGEDLRKLVRNARVCPRLPPPSLNPREAEAAAAPGGGGETPTTAPVPVPVPTEMV